MNLPAFQGPAEISKYSCLADLTELLALIKTRYRKDK